ncbi:hypothetical protein NDU88_001626, partial [Pleurodeles waltl]
MALNVGTAGAGSRKPTCYECKYTGRGREETPEELPWGPRGSPCSRCQASPGL